MNPRTPHDLAAAVRDLAMVERHIVEGRGHIARQHQIVERLVALDGDVEAARGLLAQFEVTLDAHEAHKERLLRIVDNRS